MDNKDFFRQELRKIRLNMRDLQRETYPDVNKNIVDAILCLSTTLAYVESRLDQLEIIPTFANDPIQGLVG